MSETNHTEKKARAGKAANAASGKVPSPGVQNRPVRTVADREKLFDDIRRSEDELLKSGGRELWNKVLSAITQNWLALPLFVAVWLTGGFVQLLGLGYHPFEASSSLEAYLCGKGFWGPFLIMGLFLLAYSYSLAMLRTLRSGQSRQVFLIALLLILGLSCFGLTEFAAANLQLRALMGARLSALPLALLPALATNLFDRRVATITSVFQAMLLPLLTSTEVDHFTLFYFTLFISLVAIPCFQHVERRMQFLTSGLILGILIFIAEIFYAQGGLDFKAIRLLGLSSLANGLGTGIVCIVVLPLFETIFGLSTPLSIAELTDINAPLLRRLRDAAPGTYAHSLAVADMAANAASMVGANAKLTFAMALYHDIGKLYAPGYFAENIRNGVNPHDNISPAESRDIIMEHVRFGDELARKTYHLSPLLYPAILQHHGNSLLNFFYRKACLEAEAKGETPPPPEEYRYPQQRPSSLEVAILSLADGCEAGVRALLTQQPRLKDMVSKASAVLQQNIERAKEDAGYIPETLSQLLNQELQASPQEMSKAIDERLGAIIYERLKDDQLSESTLTMKDLAAIRRSFLNTIVSQSHARPEYLR